MPKKVTGLRRLAEEIVSKISKLRGDHLDLASSKRQQILKLQPQCSLCAISGEILGDCTNRVAPEWAHTPRN